MNATPFSNKEMNLADKLKAKESLISAAKLDVEQIKTNAGTWMNLDDKQLKEALKEFLGSEQNIDLLTGLCEALCRLGQGR